MNVTALDILLALIVLTLAALGAVRRTVRQVFSLGICYLATLAAGALYPYAATFLTAIGGRTPTLTQFIVFWILFAVATVALEISLKKGFPDTSLPSLGILDNLLGLVLGGIWGVLVASLLLATMAYAPRETWGTALAPMRAAFAALADEAALRPLLAQALRLYLRAHTLWFPVPPPILALGAD